MTTAKVVRRAIRDVDGINAEAARQLESAIMSRYVFDQSMTIDQLDDIMGVVDDVLSPVYGRDRVRAARSSMFQAIVRNGKIAADEAYLRPFHEMDIRLYERFGNDWSRIRSRMIRQNGYFPNALAAIGGNQKAVRRLNLRRKKLFDPQRRWVDPRGYRLSDRIWKQGVLHRRNIDKVLKRGIKRGDGPATIAKELREYLDPDAAPLSFRRDGRILRRRRARGRFRDGQGASAARRLARTEVQRVAHDATVQSVRDLREDIPRAAVIYALSPAHPKIDICDSYADGSSRGYPPGVYLPDEVPSIPHPSCLCSRRPWVPSREEVLRDLEKKYGHERPTVEMWDGKGDGFYEWDTTEWGDSVDFESAYHRAGTIDGISDEQAYRLGYEEAKQDYFLQRGEHLAEYIDDMWDVDVELDSNFTRFIWEESDERLDALFFNTRRTADLLDEFTEFEDIAPRIQITGGNAFRSASTKMDYDLDQNLIRINWGRDEFYSVSSPLENNLNTGRFRTAGQRWTVSDSIESDLIHEFGHARHMKSLADDGRLFSEYDGRTFRGWTLVDDDGNDRFIPRGRGNVGWEGDEWRLVEREVSQYAAENPFEFVAETYYGMISGETYSDEIMDLYRLWGGIEPDAQDIRLWKQYVDGEVRFDRDNSELLDDIEDMLDNDDLFPDMDDVLSVDDVMRAMDLDRDAYDELIEYGLDQGLLDEEDFAFGGDRDLTKLRLIQALMDSQDF